MQLPKRLSVKLLFPDLLSNHLEQKLQPPSLLRKPVCHSISSFADRHYSYYCVYCSQLLFNLTVFIFHVNYCHLTRNLVNFNFTLYLLPREVISEALSHVNICSSSLKTLLQVCLVFSSYLDFSQLSTKFCTYSFKVTQHHIVQ